MAKAAASTTSKAKATESKPVKKSTSSSDEMPKTATKSKAKTRDTGKKAKKDPNAPKRGLSAYMFFANDNRDKVREENPGISFGQVGKVLGDKWKALTDKQREPYDKKAATDKQRYEKEKAAYNAREDDEDED